MKLRLKSCRRRSLLLASGLVAAALVVVLILHVVRRIFFPTPTEVFERNEADIRLYVSNIQAGKIPERASGNGYAILQVLADHDATYVQKDGNCVVITFAFMPTDAVPQLWYSPGGFDPLPQPFAALTTHKYFKWQRIRNDWAYCEWDD